MIAMVSGRTDRYGLLVMDAGTSTWTARKMKNAEFSGFATLLFGMAFRLCLCRSGFGGRNSIGEALATA